jgi:DMSO/TMAO reductase YedYZ molybdopterin-dependent catalytic subunit
MHVFSGIDSRLSFWASLITGCVMGVGRILLGGPIPPELLYDFLSRLLGIPVIFNLIHSLPFGLDRYVKFLLFGLAVTVFLLFFFFLGLFHQGMVRRLGPLIAFVAYPLLGALTVGLVLLPIQGLAVFGLSSNNYFFPIASSHLWGGGLGFAFSASLWALTPRSFRRGRRTALRNISKNVIVLTFASTMLILFQKGSAIAQKLNTLVGDILGISDEITATKNHYQVSKNIFNPSISRQSWRLTVTGGVKNTLDLTLADLRALPAVERASTLTCISNPVGGNLIGNSVWTGVRLADLLDVAAVHRDAKEVILWAADNYSDSFTLARARAKGTIVAYLHNGSPLTRTHGFPARVLVPGIYGMKNVKWVQNIELAYEDYLGYWQTRGWSDKALIKTMSRIDTEKATILPDGRAGIGGVAFAGLRGISLVEVSLNDNPTWQPATLEPPTTEFAWTLWGYAWQAIPGTYQVRVRATDGGGITQTADRRKALPNGATGYHSLRVIVSI